MPPHGMGEADDGRRPRFYNVVEEACEIIEIRLEPVYMSQLAATEHPIRQSLSAPVHCPYIEAPRVQIPGHFRVFFYKLCTPMHDNDGARGRTGRFPVADPQRCAVRC